MTRTILAGAALALFVFAAAVGATDPRDDTLPAALMLAAAVAAFAATICNRRGT